MEQTTAATQVSAVSARPSGRPRRGLALVLASGLVVGLTALTGCSGSSGGGSTADVGAGTVPAVDGPAAAAYDAASGTGSGTGGGKATAGVLVGVAPTDRALVTTASLALEVDDVTEARGRVLAIASGSGGYIASEETSSKAMDPSGSMVSVLVVRVPQARTATVLDRLRELGTVTSFDQSTTDVTTQVADVDARVRSAEASVRRIRALLASAETIGQVVAIEGQLSQRQADLESLQAQQRALADATTDATITVSVSARPSAAAASAPGGFVGGLRNGWDDLTAVLAGVLTGLGWLVPFAAFLALVAAMLFAALRFSRRRAHDLT